LLLLLLLLLLDLGLHHSCCSCLPVAAPRPTFVSGKIVIARSIQSEKTVDDCTGKDFVQTIAGHRSRLTRFLKNKNLLN